MIVDAAEDTWATIEPMRQQRTPRHQQKTLDKAKAKQQQQNNSRRRGKKDKAKRNERDNREKNKRR